MPADSCSPSRLSTVPLSGSIRIGSVELAMTTPTITRSPVTSGRITQLAAGGANGFSTSHEAGSRSTIGAPLATASRHASSSKESSSAQVADVAAQHGMAVGVGEVERGVVQVQRLAHLLQRGRGQHRQLVGADERARHAGDRGQPVEDLRGDHGAT